MLQTITIRYPDGSPVEVEADVVESLAVHESLECPGFWNVTHVPTGACIGLVYSVKEVAEDIRTMLAPLTDWSTLQMKSEESKRIYPQVAEIVEFFAILATQENNQ